MAVNLGSGRKKLPPEVARSHAVRIMFTEGQYQDLEHIAEAWGVGTATVVFAFTAKELAECRKMILNLGGLGLEFAAAVRIHDAQAKRQPDI